MRNAGPETAFRMAETANACAWPRGHSDH